MKKPSSRNTTPTSPSLDGTSSNQDVQVSDSYVVDHNAVFLMANGGQIRVADLPRRSTSTTSTSNSYSSQDALLQNHLDVQQTGELSAMISSVDDSALPMMVDEHNSMNASNSSMSAQSTPKRSRMKRRGDGSGNLTVEQKRRICEKHRSTPKITQKDLCRWARLEFHLKKPPTQPTMSNILKHEHLFKDHIGGVLGAERKTIRPTKHAHFDQVLANWVMERQNKGNITGDTIKAKGRELAKQMNLEGKLGFSNGWLASFKSRHGLMKRNMHPQVLPSQQPHHNMMAMAPPQNIHVPPASNTSANTAAMLGVSTPTSNAHANTPHNMPNIPSSVPNTNTMHDPSQLILSGSNIAVESSSYLLPQVSTDLTLEQIQETVRDYALQDIYTVDETGLYFRASPNKLVQGDDAQMALSDEPKLSIVLATNADGSDRMEPYIIGSILPPKSFKYSSLAQIGFHYVCSPRSRMTVFIFQQWLRDFNARMASAHRSVILMMDNAPSHVLGCVNLSNVRVIMFSQHMGMKVQPMRSGIIAGLKGKYRLKHLTQAIDHLEDGLPDIYYVTQLQAMRWITESWEQMPKDIILNAWKPLGLVSPFQFDSTTIDTNGSTSNPQSNSGQLVLDTPPDQTLEEELWGMVYCLKLTGIVTTKALVNSRWENDIHKRLNEEILDDPQENDAEFRLPDLSGSSILMSQALNNNSNGNVEGSSALSATDVLGQSITQGEKESKTLGRSGNHSVNLNQQNPNIGIGSYHPQSGTEQLKAFRDVIRFLERTGTPDNRDPQLLSVLEFLKKKQLGLRFDHASGPNVHHL